MLLVLPVLITTLLYAAGYIAQFLYHYNTWVSAGGTPGDGSSPPLPDASFFSCLQALTIFPYCIYGIFLCLLVAILLLFVVMRMGIGGKGTLDKERNFSYSEKGTYGTSGYMTPEEFRNVLNLTSDIRRSTGIILGTLENKIVCLPESSPYNRNVAVFGASGSMKSRAYARNVIFQCVARGESLIVTDPKSELYGDFALYLDQHGYTVRVFNLIHPENSDSWNCLSEIDGQDTMAQLFCDVIIKNTSSKNETRFWADAELNILKAAVLYVYYGFPPEGRNIGQVYKLLTLNTEEELCSLFQMLPNTHPAKYPYSIFRRAQESVRNDVVSGLGIRLQVFQNELIRQITGHNEIDLTLPGKEKCAYFCITSDQDSTFDFLSSLFMSFVFIKLVRYADEQDGSKLPVPVHILADEIANGGCTIADLTKKISTIRSRQLSISCIFQNLPQMQNRYPDNQWQEIIGNCDTQLFLGCTDQLTAKFISDRSGEISVDVSSKAKQLNTFRITDYSPQYRETASVGKRKLLNPDEVLRLPLDQALITLRGQKILKVGKYDFSLHPESKKLQYTKATDHIPAWRAQNKEEWSAPIQSTKKKTSTKPQPEIVMANKASIMSK